MSMTTNSGGATDAPKRRQKASKNNKKSWRKNTNLDDVDEFLDDQRLEERLGGAFGDRPDDALFIVENEAKRDADESPKPVSRLEARKRRAEKPLKCFQQLENTSKVADPKKGRNSRRLPEERENPIVKDMNKRLREQGIVRMKEQKSSADKVQYAANKKATQVERLTRRRTKFDFDLWDELPKDASAETIKADEWLDPVTKGHVLKNSGKLKRKVPADFHRTLSALPSIELPHGGMSYNPSYKDHQALLFRAAVVEMKKEKEQNRIEYHTTRMFPKAGEAPTAETWLSEMSEGLKKDNEDEGEDEVKAGSESDGEDANLSIGGTSNKLRTRKQRRKAKELMAEQRRLQRLKANKLKNDDIYLLKAMKKNLNKEDALLQGRLEKRRLQKQESMLSPALLSKNKFEEPEIDLKLSDELTGNLRSLKPEGNILQDRFKSLQKRNVFETTVKEKPQKQKKRKLKRKVFERKSYKLPGHSQKK